MNKNLYVKNLKRLELLKIAEESNGKNINISIYRNHSFELVASTINAFLAESNLHANFLYSDYDDSFNFQYQNADIHIIWVDLSRYSTTNVNEFLSERANVLRTKTDKPILVIYTGKHQTQLDFITTNCYGLSVDSLLDGMDKVYDPEKESFSGTRISGGACLELARILGLKYIPALVLPPFKAIVVDLDNTLYSGILGEDGVSALTPNIEFQKQLKKLKDDGFFLCIASKNEESDVIEMFQQRKDFPLQWSDFTTTQINWNSKGENLLKIAKTLNINTDAILFIDDNPAEIQNVDYAGVSTLLAENDVADVVKYFPGLLKMSHSKEDALRARDVQANEERARLAESLSPEQYFQKLGIKLSFHIDDKEQIVRVAELLGKTNQFILTYARLNETNVSDIMNAKDSCVITIRMSDNLSDSGVIAILVAHTTDNIVVMDELTVSCRALGRNLENIMLPYMFKLASEKLNTKSKIRILYKKGPRNGPALNWLQKLTDANLDAECGTIEYNIPEKIETKGIDIEVV